MAGSRSKRSRYRAPKVPVVVGVSPSKAPGVVYSENELMPGQPMFGCTRLSAVLRVESCVTMWRQANAGPPPVERLLRCRGCTVGACHAGAVDPTYHPLRGTTTCSRCHGRDKRLIGGNVCVSCKNREYEWVKGRNAKGKFPTQHPALCRRRVRFLAGGRVGSLVRELSVSTTELVVELLRDSGSRVMLGFGRGVMRG